MQAQINSYLDTTYTNGPGKRTAVFFQGCAIRCVGCQNAYMWDADPSKATDLDSVAARLLDTGLDVSILGGEPFMQPEPLAALVLRLKQQGREVIVYSGFTLEELLILARGTTVQLLGLAAHYMTNEPINDFIAQLMVAPYLRTNILQVLMMADVLVDGPFIQSQDNAFMQYRGSANQRPLDLNAMRAAGKISVPILLDWDTPRLTITEDGSIIGAEGLMQMLFGGDTLKKAQRCGQVT